MAQIPSTQIPLHGVKACLFDAYGTLFDFASAVRACKEIPSDAVDKLTALWRDKQLQYTWLRAAQARHADFWQVTGEALDFALETLAIERAGLRDRLMRLYLTPDVFPEVPRVLGELKGAGLRTAILSNGTPRMLEAAVSNASSAGCSIPFFSSRRSASTKLTPRSISSPWTGSRCRHGRSRSSPRIPGTPMRRLRSACRSCGAIDMVSGGSGFPARPTAR
jgi:2-haloalkanoic acid dehalogenase type II